MVFRHLGCFQVFFATESVEMNICIYVFAQVCEYENFLKLQLLHQRGGAIKILTDFPSTEFMQEFLK